MSNLPIVRVDYTDHPLYSTTEHYKLFCRVWDAEVLSMSFTKRSMRVRLYDIETGEVFQKNHDTSFEYVVPGQSFNVDFT